MAWRGIKSIISGKGDKLVFLHINPKTKLSPSTLTWTNTEEVDKDKEGNISSFWKKIRYDSDFIDEFLKNEKDISLWEIDQFRNNDGFILVNDLFPGTTKRWCVFRRNANRNALWVVGSKTLKEQQICGFTKQNSKHPQKESFCPLIVSVKDKKFYLLNSK